MEPGHLAVALEAEPTPRVLRIDDVNKFGPEAGGAHEASVNVVAGGILAAVFPGHSARVDDADALRHGLRDVIPDPVPEGSERLNGMIRLSLNARKFCIIRLGGHPYMTSALRGGEVAQKKM